MPLFLSGNSGKAQGVNGKLCSARFILANYFKKSLGGSLPLIL